jgi:hypothetical protein
MDYSAKQALILDGLDAVGQILGWAVDGLAYRYGEDLAGIGLQE